MGSLLGMPWAMINLGCEMVYILHQRLNAQGIPPNKSVQVLQDIVRTMLEPGFLADKLFVAQDMYSLASTRKVFDKIAHSSIMKLSENSMDKLFDLMTMGAKYCLLCSTQLDDMMQVTLRHLKAVGGILASAAAACSPPCAVDAVVLQLLSNAEDSTTKFYGGLCAGELLLLRSTLARYLQDKRVRVSLFLAEGIQLQSGKLVIASCLDARVGLVRSFAADGTLESEERLQMASQQVDRNEFFCHPVPLGDNLYRKDRPKVVPPQRAADMAQQQLQQDKQEQQQKAEAQPKQQEPQPAASDSQCGRYEQQQQQQPQLDKQAAKELDFLAHLVHVAQPAADDNFRLNLFVLDDDEEVEGQQAASASAGRTHKQQQHHLQFGSDGRNEAYIKAARLGDVLEQVQLEEHAGGVGSVGDELLSLMDSLG